MSLLISLAALGRGSVTLSGELTPEEVGFDHRDPCVEAQAPLRYELTAQIMGPEVLVEGELATVFRCQCVRCLESFDWVMEIKPWACLIPISGEDAPPLVNESVDLTPQIREDSFLALPQHPLCGPECPGPPKPRSDSSGPDGPSGQKPRMTTAWSVLDTLNLE
jgi:uncharacterized metal-binding protein YceD (DUF177 family)